MKAKSRAFPFAIRAKNGSELSANRAAIQESDSRRGRLSGMREATGANWLILQELEILARDPLRVESGLPRARLYL
jgi:hypothetical protein